MGVLDTLLAGLKSLTSEEERNRLRQQKWEEDRAQAQRETDKKALAEQENARKAAEAEKQRLPEGRSPADRLTGQELATSQPAQQPVQPPEPVPEPDRGEEAKRLELSRNSQPAPSIAGPGKTFVNPRAVEIPPAAQQEQQPEAVKAPVQVESDRSVQDDQNQAPRPERPPFSPAALNAKVLKGIEREKREKREAEEAGAVLKALEEGRVGKTEREMTRGGRRMT